MTVFAALSAEISINRIHLVSVLRTDSHPVLPVLASCSVTGNCILIDITDASSPKVLNCFHLHGDSLDRIRFSLRGEHLAIGNSQSGRIFIVDKQREGRHADVLGLVEVGGHVRSKRSMCIMTFYKRCIKAQAQ